MNLEMELLRRDLRQLEQKVDASSASTTEAMTNFGKSIEGLVGAWETGTGLVTFIKWLSTATAAVSLMWHIFKGWKG
jgi:uncharacterized BrkB/YihY/UPF0761 family membrane protein